MEKIYWIHQIPLPDGTVTPGVSRPAIDDFGLEDIEVSEKRVLDIGCLDGLYTFYAEGRNAAEVVSIDILGEQFGKQGDEYNTGSGYLWAHKHLGSKAKYAFPFSLYNIPQLGKFDVVYCCMGVLYHLAHPMLAIEKINRALNLGRTQLHYFRSAPATAKRYDSESLEMRRALINSKTDYCFDLENHGTIMGVNMHHIGSMAS